MCQDFFTWTGHEATKSIVISFGYHATPLQVYRFAGNLPSPSPMYFVRLLGQSFTSGIWLDAFVAVRHWSPDTSRIFSVLRAFARLHAEVFMHVRRRLKTGHLVNLYGSSLVWLGSSFYC